MIKMDRKEAERIIDNGELLDLRWGYKKTLKTKLMAISYISYEGKEYIIGEIEWNNRHQLKRELNDISYYLLTLEDTIKNIEFEAKEEMFSTKPLEEALEILKKVKEVD